MSNAAPQARRTGLARQLGLEHNPLRRRIDRLQACLMAGLLAAFLTGAPLLAIAAGSWIRAPGLREERAQQGWHQVPVVLAQTAPHSTPELITPGEAGGSRLQLVGSVRR